MRETDREERERDSRGEMMDGHDAGRARLLRELSCLGESSHDVLQTGVAETRVATIRGRG